MSNMENKILNSRDGFNNREKYADYLKNDVYRKNNLCKQVYDNIENTQLEREKMLDEFLKRVKPLARKYLSLLYTEDEEKVGELLNNEFNEMFDDENFQYMGNVIDIANNILISLNDELHKNDNVIII